MSLDIETKSLASGYDTALILGGRDCFVRKTNLPSNWTRVRIALIASMTNLTSSNGPIITESIQTTSVSPGQQFTIGLSNGIGLYGQSGSANQFVGISNNVSIINNVINSVTIQCISSSSIWGMGQSNTSTVDTINFNSTWSTGSTINQTSNQAYTLFANTGDPTATSSFCFYWGIDIALSSLGAVTALGVSSTPNSITNDAALLGIYSRTFGALGVPTGTGGWWAGGNPVGCTYLYIRWPFLSSRLRIHNMGVMQIG
jgi:hypothetical protein